MKNNVYKLVIIFVIGSVLLSLFAYAAGLSDKHLASSTATPTLIKVEYIGGLVNVQKQNDGTTKVWVEPVSNFDEVWIRVNPNSVVTETCYDRTCNTGLEVSSVQIYVWKDGKFRSSVLGPESFNKATEFFMIPRFQVEMGDEPVNYQFWNSPSDHFKARISEVDYRDDPVIKILAGYPDDVREYTIHPLKGNSIIIDNKYQLIFYTRKNADNTSSYWMQIWK